MTVEVTQAVSRNDADEIAVGPFMDRYLDGSSFSDDRRELTQAFARHRLTAVRELEAQLAEAREENERLRKLTQGQWFYPADGYESENCHYSPDEVIDYLDLEVGVHVVEVNVATPLPSIWCAVRVTDDDDADERVTFTEHSSEDKARAFLSRTGGEG